MSVLIVSDFFAERAKLKFTGFTVGETEFVLMAVDKGQREEVELCDSSAEMIKLAANFGISYDRKRVVDDTELAKDIDMMWEVVESNEPNAKARDQVGVEVLIISDLHDTYKDMVETEAYAENEAKNLIKQQLENNPHIDIHQMAEDNAIDDQLNP